jgi:hypothetical protein
MDTVAPAAPSSIPGLVVSEARVARSVLGPLRMKASMLVERNGVWRVLVAEDVSATTAVMPSFEKGKFLVAGWTVAFRRRRVGLISNVSITLVKRSLKSSDEIESPNLSDNKRRT